MKKMTLKQFCEINNVPLSRIKDRMKQKGMTREEALEYKSSKDLFKPIKEKAIILGLNVNTIRFRFNKGLRGKKLFSPIKERGKAFYKYLYKGKPLTKILTKSSYFWFIRNKKNYKNVKIAMIEAIRKEKHD